jgi:hypothetical protein
MVVTTRTDEPTAAEPTAAEPLHARITPFEAAGLALLAVAIVQNHLRRRTTSVAMRAYAIRRQARMSIVQPGATTALVAGLLLEHSRRARS